MKIYSLSRDLLNGVYYKDKASVQLDIVTQNGVTESSFSTSSIHIGTHIDLPLHFGGIEKVIEPMIYEVHEVLVIKSAIDSVKLKLNSNIKMVILDYEEEQLRRTDNNYSTTFNSPSLESVKYIISNCPRIECVATSSLSIGSARNGAVNRSVHSYLLRDLELIILEDVDMTNFKNDFKYIVIQPLKLGAAEACWASVSLLC